MFRFAHPSPALLDAFLQSQQAAPYSYAAVGMTRDEPPTGFVVDRREIQLGRGKQAYLAACNAVRNWKVFDLPWVQLAPAVAPIQAGTVVAVFARAAGMWALGACRIVYTIDEPKQFGFAYGTLAHVEQGEERFLVEWRNDDTVWYEILAYSRPGSWLTALAYPFARYCQKCFGTGSLKAMRRAVEAASFSPVERL